MDVRNAINICLWAHIRSQLFVTSKKLNEFSTSWRSFSFLAKVERCQSQAESHTRAEGDMMDCSRKRFVFAASNGTEQSIFRIEVAWMCAADAERRAPSSCDVTRLLLLFSFNVSKSQKQNANRRADNYRKTLKIERLRLFSSPRDFVLFQSQTTNTLRRNELRSHEPPGGLSFRLVYAEGGGLFIFAR